MKLARIDEYALNGQELLHMHEIDKYAWNGQELMNMHEIGKNRWICMKWTGIVEYARDW